MAHAENIDRLPDGAATRDAIAALDRGDPLRTFREAFVIPPGMIYLDGNSLGLLPKAAAARARQTVEDEWGQSAISGWNDHHWIDLPLRVGARIARLIGAGEDEVVAGETTSINLFKCLAAAVDDGVAAITFSHVDYKTARIEDMAGITAGAHAAGALAIWDLCHSAGA